MGSVGNKSSADNQRLAEYKKTLDDNFKHYEHEGYDIYKVGNQYAAYDFNKEYTPEQLKKIKSVADVAVEYGKTLKELKNSLSKSREASSTKGFYTPSEIVEDKFRAGSMSQKSNSTYSATLKDSDGNTVYTFTGKTKQEVQDQIDYYKKTGNYTKRKKRNSKSNSRDELPW